MRWLSISVLTVVSMVLVITASSSAKPCGFEDSASPDSKNKPVLVELFTSESCSSCPPADRLLAQLGKSDPSVIVLSEHVTYWNETGWNDPYSSREATDRQSAYVSRMGLSSSYTPQMVVDGRYEFVGGDASAANRAIQKAASATPVAIDISDLKKVASQVTFSISTGNLAKDAELLVILTQDEGIEHVANGENGGRTLRHVQIARVFRPIAFVKHDEAYHGKLSVDLPQPIAGSGWHLVAFLQQGSGGPILGVTTHGV